MSMWGPIHRHFRGKIYPKNDVKVILRQKLRYIMSVTHNVYLSTI